MYIVHTFDGDGNALLANVVMDLEESLREFVRAYTGMSQGEEDAFITELHNTNFAQHLPMFNAHRRRAISVGVGQRLNGYA